MVAGIGSAKTNDDAGSTSGPQPGARRRISASAFIAALVGIVAVGAALMVQRPPTANEIEQATEVVALQRSDTASAESAVAAEVISPAEPVTQATSIPATAAPTPVPTRAPPTTAPAPTVVEPLVPELLPPSADNEFSPRTQPDGRISVMLQGVTSFELPRPLPVQVYQGHAIVYLDDGFVGEVDLLVPFQSADGQRLVTYDDVLGHIETDPKFRQFSPPLLTDVNGIQAASYFGIADEFELGFITGRVPNGDEDVGWFMPAQMWLWVLDGPDGPIVVTGELLSESPREAEISALLADVLQSIIFHP